MSNEQVANWLLRQASRRPLTAEESRWLDHYHCQYREDARCAENGHPWFWFSITFLCGMTATLVLLLS